MHVKMSPCHLGLERDNLVIVPERETFSEWGEQDKNYVFSLEDLIRYLIESQMKPIHYDENIHIPYKTKKNGNP